MSSTTTADVARGGKARGKAKATVAGILRDELVEMLADAKGIRWPDRRYWEDPVRFAEEILGMRTWSAQRRILEAYVRHKRVTVRSGHKIGKSNTAAIIALHFYCSLDDARVVFTSTTARQVDAILWRELGKIRSKAGCCLTCREACRAARRPEPRPCAHSSLIGGTMNSLARSGFRADDFREISGFTARDAEAVAGISGANLLYIPDEASGIDDAIFEAIEGNRAGGARIVMFSNPTRTEGEFYLSHTDKAMKLDASGAPVVDADGKPVGFYYAIQVSSEETPNVVERRDVIPGLASWEWVDEKRLEWGVDSPLYKVRVKGEFVTAESGKIISIALISEAEGRWEDASEEGRLHIGLDPAGDGVNGDETAWAVRRGQRVIKVTARRGLSVDGIVEETLGLIRTHRNGHEAVPIVAVDVEGEIGLKVAAKLALHESQKPGELGELELRRVKASTRIGRPPYERIRDALWGNLRDFLRHGGAIPEDAKLAKELHAPAWHEITGTELVKVTPKSDLRKALGRSTDRADAVALSVWEAVTFRIGTEDRDDQEEADAAPAAAPDALVRAAATSGDDEDDDELAADRVFDPYGGGLS